MKAGSVYYHFESKEQIISEVRDLGIEMVHQEVENAIQSAGPAAPDLVRAGITGSLKALLEYSNYTSANVRIYGQMPGVMEVMRTVPAALWRHIITGCRQMLNKTGCHFTPIYNLVPTCSPVYKSCQPVVKG
jgi:AcrR family transcriptional regulator